MREVIEENKAIFALFLVVGVAGATFAATQTDIMKSVTGSSEDQHGDAMQAQGDSMEPEGDAMESDGSMDSEESMENDSMDSEDSMNESMNDSMEQ